MFNYEEEIKKLDGNISKAIENIVKDLSKIKKYKTLSLSPWKSNLPDILPFIGNKMEHEIRSYLKWMEIQNQDLRQRKNIFNELI